VTFPPQVHGPQCLRCTYSTVRKVSARGSCCTAVRDRKAYALQRCQVGELSCSCPAVNCNWSSKSAANHLRGLIVIL
jgi:hypothetical protein